VVFSSVFVFVFVLATSMVILKGLSLADLGGDCVFGDDCDLGGE